MDSNKGYVTTKTVIEKKTYGDTKKSEKDQNKKEK